LSGEILHKGRIIGQDSSMTTNRGESMNETELLTKFYDDISEKDEMPTREQISNMKAFRVTYRGITSIVFAPVRGKATMSAVNSILDCGYNFHFRDIRTTRAPEYDDMPKMTLLTPLKEELVREELRL
jgi:hypothetical protein